VRVDAQDLGGAFRSIDFPASVFESRDDIVALHLLQVLALHDTRQLAIRGPGQRGRPEGSASRVVARARLSRALKRLAASFAEGRVLQLHRISPFRETRHQFEGIPGIRCCFREG
jgi:hypothetical protein